MKRDLKNLIKQEGLELQEFQVNKATEKSRKSTFGKAGLDILSQERGVNHSYSQKEKAIPLYNRTANLNRSSIGPHHPDEWDNIILNDVKKYEEEQRETLRQKQKVKRQIMEDLNVQIMEKKKLQK